MRHLLRALICLVAAPLWAAGAQQPAGKPVVPAADAELLEFLGSLDAEEEGWQEFLAERPIDTAQGKPAPAQKTPAARTPAGRTEQVKGK